MSRILITGATGFIGRQSLAYFPDWEVHAITRSQPPMTNTNSVIWHSLDLFDTQAVNQLLQSIQTSHLLHFAWEARPGIYWHSLDNYRWVAASLALLNAFYEQGGKRAVIAGTCAEYLWDSDYCVENETPLSYSTPYAASKASLSHLALSFAKQTGMSLAWGRIFFPYGPYEPEARLIPSLIRSLHNKEMVEIKHGEQIRDFLHVSDMADAFSALLRSEFQGAVNIGSGQAIALKEIGTIIADTLNARDFLNIAENSDDKSRVVADISILSETLAWTPHYNLNDGLHNSIEWWQSQLENLD